MEDFYRGQIVSGREGDWTFFEGMVIDIQERFGETYLLIREMPIEYRHRRELVMGPDLPTGMKAFSLYPRLFNVPADGCRPDTRAHGYLNRMTRKRHDWMLLDQEDVENLEEENWKHYERGGCLCAAHDSSECICGSWHRGDP